MRAYDQLARLGIACRPRTGTQKTLCPRCSHARRHRTDRCLSLTVDQDGEHAVWLCHHCGWRGGLRTETARTAPYRGDRGARSRPRADGEAWRRSVRQAGW